MYAVLVSLLPTGIRVLYSVVAVFSSSTALDPVTGSLALKVCLSVVPEMVVVVLFTVVGLWTRNLKRK